MSIIIDLIVLAIIIITAFVSAKYGFVRTAIEIIGFVLILFVVNSSSVVVAEKIYDGFIAQKIASASETITEDTVNSSDVFFDKLPEFVTKTNGIFGVDEEKIKNDFSSNLENGVKSATDNVSENVIKPAVLKPISLIVSILLFVILNAIVKIIAKLIDKLVKHSFAKGLNSKLGFVIGLPKGVVVALMFMVGLLIIINVTKNGIWIFTKENISNSYSAEILSKYLPSSGIFSYLFNA